MTMFFPQPLNAGNQRASATASGQASLADAFATASNPGSQVAKATAWGNPATSRPATDFELGYGTAQATAQAEAEYGTALMQAGRAVFGGFNTPEDVEVFNQQQFTNLRPLPTPRPYTGPNDSYLTTARGTASGEAIPANNPPQTVDYSSAPAGSLRDQVEQARAGQSQYGAIGSDLKAAYNTDIPYYSDFARNVIKPTLRGAVDSSVAPTFAYNLIANKLPYLPSTGQVAESAVPVSAGDVAVELVPGVGMVPGTASLIRTAGREGLETAVRRAVTGIATPEEALGDLPATALRRSVLDVPANAPEAARLAETGGRTVIPRSASAARASNAPFGVRLVGASETRATYGRGRVSVGSPPRVGPAVLREVAPEATEEMRFVGDGLSINPRAVGISDDVAEQSAALKANPKGKTALQGKLDAQADAVRFINSNPTNAADAYNAILEAARTAGGPLPRQRGYRDELARIVNDLIEIDDDLSISFRPDVLTQPSAAARAVAEDPITLYTNLQKAARDELKAVNQAVKSGTMTETHAATLRQEINARIRSAGMKLSAAKKAAGVTSSSVPAGAASPPPTLPPPTRTFSASDDFAGNIRLSKYPDDIRDSVKSWADSNPDVVDAARRGTITSEQTEQMARDLVNDVGGNWQKVQNGWKAGQAWNAEEITAIRGALEDATRKVMQAAENARTVDSSANHVVLAEAILRQQRIQQIVHGVTAEAGRSLQAFRRQAIDALENNDVRRMQELLNHALKLNDGKDIENLTALIRALDINDPVAVNAFLRNVNKPGVGDMLYEVWINSVLSGPVTHLRNILGNTAATLYSPLERAGGALVEAPIARLQGRQSQRFWQEAPASVAGMARGLPEGVRGALNVMRHGFDAADVGKLEIRRQAVPGIPGRAIRIPTNALEAMDTFFHAINYRSALYADAVRQARREGLKGEALTNRISDLVSNPNVGLIKSASDEAERLLFRNDPGQAVNALMNFRNKVPGLKYVLPFVKTPANLMKYGVKHSPLGLLDVPMWKRVAAGNPEGSDELARALMGSGVAAGFAAMVASGDIDITAGAPTDSAERDRFFREGKMPFSIKLPGLGWVEYKQIPVLDTALTSVAAVVEGVRNGQNVDDIAWQAAATFGQNMLDKSYLNGVADLFDAVADPERYAERFAVRQITGFVPFSAALRQTAQAVDPTYRSPQGLGENIRAGIPGLTGTVQARRDAFGQVVSKTTPPFSPVGVAPDRQSRVDAELERIGTEVGFVGDRIGEIKLSRQWRDAYQAIAGRVTYNVLDALFQSPAYKNAKPEAQQDMVEKAIAQSRTPVREAIKQMIESGEEP